MPPSRKTRNRTPRTAEGSPPTYDESKSDTPPALPPITSTHDDGKAVMPKNFNCGLVSRFATAKPENHGDEKEYSGKIMIYVIWLKILEALERGDTIWAKFYLGDLVSAKRYIYGDVLSNLVKVRDLYLDNHANPSTSIMLGPINEALFKLQ
jgi:hypothetical protein